MAAECLGMIGDTSSGMAFYRLNARLGMERFVRGVNYWRYVEYPWVIDNLCLAEGQRILDIGSSSCSLLPLFLAYRRRYVVFVTDIDERVLNHVALARKLGLTEQTKSSRLIVERQDATALKYEDETFDRVTAVSVLEHLPDQEDTKAMKELCRVLKGGGLALVTVPYCYRYRETFVNQDIYQRAYSGGPVFYQRHYDVSSLATRLVEPSGMKVRRIEYYGETGARFERIWDSLPLPVKGILAWMTPIFSTLFIGRIEDSADRRAMAAFLVLEKSA